MNMPFATILAIVLTSLALSTASAVVPETITIDPTSRYAVNGVADIQPVRSMVVNGESRGKRADEAMALRMSGSRLYLWVDFAAIDEPKGLSNYNLGLPDRVGWLLGHDMDAFVHAQFDRHLGIDPTTGKADPKLQNPSFISVQYQQLELLRQWKATKNVTLQVIQPHPRSTADFAQYSRYYRAILREVRARFPELDVRYLMLYNEPNISYLGSGDKNDRAGRIKLFYDLYNYVAADVAKEFPTVSLIGPSLSQFNTWSDWNDWSVPFLTQAPTARYFGAQIYSRRFDELLAWNGMLQAKSIAMNGHRVPMVITEWNPESLDSGALPGGAEYWKDKNQVTRVALLSEALFGMMAHPDQFPFTSFFFYDCSHDGYDLWQKHDGVVSQTAGYWFYHALRDVTGERVYAASDTAASNIRTIAAVDGRRLVIAASNSAAEAASVTLALTSVKPAQLTNVRIDRLRYDSPSEKFVHTTETLATWPSTSMLAAGEIAVYSADLPANSKRERTLTERDVYSSDTALTVREKPIAVTIPAVALSNGDQPYLRAGIYCDDVRAINRIDCSLNGHPIRVPFQPDTRETKPRTVLHIDLPVPTSWLAKTNQVTFAPSEAAPYGVMFASLAVLPRPAGAPALRSLPVVTDASPMLDISAKLPAEVIDGESAIRVRLANHSPKPIECRIAVTLPAGWKPSGPTTTVVVPPMGSVARDIQIVVPATTQRMTVPVTTIVTAQGIVAQSTQRWTVHQPRLVAVRVASPPSMDGTLAGWPGAPFVEEHPALAGGVPYRTSTWLAWDDRRLYIAVRVTGRHLMSVAAGKEPWGRDTLEVFTDFTGTKPAKRTARTMQTVLVLNRDATNKADWFNAPTNVSGESVARTVPESFVVNVTRHDDGFTAQASLDWASLDSAPNVAAEPRFVPHGGERIGFELGLAAVSLLGGGPSGSMWSNPSAWGTLTLADGASSTKTPKFTPLHVGFSHPDPASVARLTIPATYPVQGGSLTIPSVDGGGLSVTLTGDAPSPASGFGVTTAIILSGFAATTSGDSSAYQQSIRAFWTPRPLTGFLEPFAMPGPLVALVADYSKRSGVVTLALSRKDTANSGLGSVLWTGTMAAASLPVKAALTLDAAHYRIVFDKPVETVTGSQSGATLWNPADWSAPLHFGLHAVNQSGVPGSVLIGALSIAAG
ncbi:MAG TPA: sugar-binding protein [Capsulimonadaceae bacterium]|jgi:hypothetical protein